jgi:inositol-1,3,4-trisphosphate 5/6-kinase/inositol-tetrakisphosphate 1-kinase
MGFVEFDSQRPYPRFRDFGFPEDGVEKVAAGPTSDSPSKIVMTVEEVMPIVDALKAAFGLELFGFDILLAGNDDHSSRRKMMIVDVNYFPSYKEVSNFPALLAKYLTDRAIESRRRANIPTGKPV